MVSIVIMAAKTLAQMCRGTGPKKSAGRRRGARNVRDLDRAGESAGRDRGAGLEDGAGCRVGERGKDGRDEPVQDDPGSAFEADLGNQLRPGTAAEFPASFPIRPRISLLKRIRAAMNPGSIVATVEFVPNEDRVTPPNAAMFSMMIAGEGTQGGDAYTFAELDKMFREAGFGESLDAGTAAVGRSGCC